MKTIKKAVKYFGSQAELARKIGVRHDEPYKWLKGIRTPSIRSAFAIELETKGVIKADEILREKLLWQEKRKKIKKEKD